MKWIRRTLRCFQIFLGAVAFLVGFDMLILGGKIKLWWIAMGNTTSSSPFSTDGQSNWILILIIVGVVLLVAYLLNTPIFRDKEEKEDESEEEA